MVNSKNITYLVYVVGNCSHKTDNILYQKTAVEITTELVGLFLLIEPV